MSYIVTKVSKIQNCDSLHIIKFDFHQESLYMVSLDIDDEIKIGTKVKLAIKPSNIAIAKNFSGNLSYLNQLNSNIISFCRKSDYKF